MTTKTNVDHALLSAILDRLIPAVGDVPAAGHMGLTEEIVRLSGQQKRFQEEFESAMSMFADFSPDFASLQGVHQDDVIRKYEAANSDLFASILTISYIVYYKDERVHNRLGWSSKTPQPDGNEMEPWDESVLDKMRTREPFWRQVE
jgi:hypothetical protein